MAVTVSSSGDTAAKFVDTGTTGSVDLFFNNSPVLQSGGQRLLIGDDVWTSEGTLLEIELDDLNIVNYGAMVGYISNNVPTNLSVEGVAYLSSNQTFVGENTFSNIVTFQDAITIENSANVSTLGEWLSSANAARSLDIDTGILKSEFGSVDVNTGVLAIDGIGTVLDWQNVNLEEVSGTMWTVEGTADEGNEIMNYTTFASIITNYAHLPSYNEFLNSNKFFNTLIIEPLADTNLVTQTKAITFTGGTNVTGFISGDIGAYFELEDTAIAELVTTNYAGRFERPSEATVYLSDTGFAINVLEGATYLQFAETTHDATNDIEIVNWRTMTNSFTNLVFDPIYQYIDDQNFARRDAANTFTEDNTFNLAGGDVFEIKNGGSTYMSVNGSFFQLYDTATSIAIDVFDRELVQNPTGSASLDWENLVLTGDWTVSTTATHGFASC